MESEYSSYEEPLGSPPPPPNSTRKRHNKTDSRAEVDESQPPSPDSKIILHKFTIYETRTRLYVVGSNLTEDSFRILKVDRTSTPELMLTTDEVIYSKADCIDLLSRIDQGNKLTGGLTKVMSAFGLVGFVKFLEGYYLCVITKRKAIALIGGHYIYHLEGTSLLNVTAPSQARLDRHPDEARYLNIFQNMDLSKNFYFSYTYDLTHSLQRNVEYLKSDTISTSNTSSSSGLRRKPYQELFVWNHHLLTTGFGKECLTNPSDWVLPLIHGFVDQAKISVFGRSLYVTLIARRSRKFAGTRFLKRGADLEGHVANEVETEQIVHDLTTTPLVSLGVDGVKVNPFYSSYLQHRGSIPLAWGQDISTIAPKPPIHIMRPDPFATMAALHFRDLFQRYNSPIIILNLIKAKEKTPRESRLLKEFTSAVQYLTSCLPDPNRLVYIPWDMSRASKSPDQDVINYLEELAEDALAVTGFFLSGPEPYAWQLNDLNYEDDYKNSHLTTPFKQQNGIVRTNCIDCIDRTNAAQFLIGKCALAYQLHALGVLMEPHLPFDCDAVDMLTEMYHDHGDTLALQYGGSNLVNTMATYRNINQNWTSHSRDVIEAIRRFYTNSFVDAERQEAINLFLGIYIPGQPGQPKLWELSTDYYLHNKPSLDKLSRPHYIKWWQEDINPSDGTSLTRSTRDSHLKIHTGDYLIDPEDTIVTNFWDEYYRPHLFTSFSRLLAFNINSTTQIRQGLSDQVPTLASPFTVHPHLFRPASTEDTGDIRFGKWFSLPGKKAAKTKTKAKLRRSMIPSEKDPALTSHLTNHLTGQSKDSLYSHPTASKSELFAPPTSELTVLVNNLLTPRIPDAERSQYERYVGQLGDLPSQYLNNYLTFDPTLDEDEIEWDSLVHHPDYEAFVTHLQAGEGCLSPTDKGDYAGYAALPSSYLTSEPPQTTITSNQTKSDAYATWLRTGRYRMGKSSIKLSHLSL